MNISRTVKFVYCALCLLIFCRLFLFDHSDWQSRFARFAVPAFTYPGADSRNIQVAAYCSNRGHAYFEDSECFKDATIVKRLYPQASVPALNYPSIWPRAYSLFNDDSERFFMEFWSVNALCLALVIFLFCLKLNYLLVPLLLFNPVTLLTVERGNIDATVFAVMFLPLLLVRARPIIGLMLALATSMKLFPAFAFLTFCRAKRPFFPKSLLFGAAFGLPFLVRTLLDGPAMVGKTTHGFSISYGLTSILNSSWGSAHRSSAIGFIAVFLVILATLVYRNASSAAGGPPPSSNEETADAEFRDTLTCASLITYVATFMVFDNWSYRLIVLYPALLVASTRPRLLHRWLFWNILLVLWVPLLPHGWLLQNPCSYALVLPAALVLLETALTQFKGDRLAVRI